MSKENKVNAPAPSTDDGDKEDSTTVFKIPVGSSPSRGNPAALDGTTHTSEIETDKKTANDGGISGTPAFIVLSLV
jgi:hypothetical protein